MISYQNISRIRREVENILLLVYELEDKGIPKDVIINAIIDEPKKSDKKDECPCKDK